MSTAPDPVLSVSDLTVRYGSVTAVDDVSFMVTAGACVGLVGESGSGKSTIGLAVQGLLARERAVAATGRITIAGSPLEPGSDAGWAAVRGAQVTTVFQDPMTSLDPTMTVGRALDHVTRSRAASRDWLAQVEIRDPDRALRAYPHQLSGGMRQRVMIALALARRPQVLIADEPTTALDVSVQAGILQLLRREQAEFGFGMVFVTHDLGVARAMCDEIIVMRDGRVVESGPAGRVFEAPEHEYTRRLMASRITLSSDRSAPIGRPEATVLASMQETLAVAEEHDAPLGETTPIAVPDVAERWADGTLSWRKFIDPRVPARGSLHLEGIAKTFATGVLARRRAVPVLDGVDLEIGPRESVALVGESGSGKSTILRIAAGLERPSAGIVRLDDPHRAGVQVVFQDAGSSLTPWLTVDDLLRERLQNAGTGEERSRARCDIAIREALERVALPEAVRTRRASELSGGQRQRVAIARAIVVPPALLLCDEPTSALDVSVASSVLNLLNLIRHSLGLSMLFVTHDLAAARVVSDRIDVIHQGRIIESRPADEVPAYMTSDYGRKLVDAVLA